MLCRRSCPLSLLILLFGLISDGRTVHAQVVTDGNSPGSSINPSTPATVSGHVVNTLTGESIPGASLHLRSLRSAVDGDDSDPQTTSSGDGGFVFSQVPPGTYLLRAEKDGFITTPLNRHIPFLTIASGDTKNDVGVQLTPQATITGRVMEDEGKAVTHARVTAYVSIPEHGRTKLQRVAAADVDQTGKFTLQRLKSGSYYLVADPDGGGRGINGSPARQNLSASPELARTFFPNGVDFGSAGVIQVAAGQGSSDITINMRRLRTHRLEGKLSELSPGMQVSNLRISLNQDGAVDTSALAQRTEVTAGGRWAIENVVPGAYTLQLSGLLSGPSAAGGSRPHAPLGEQHVEVGAADVTDIVLTVDPPLQLNGTISIEGTNTSNLPFSRIRIVARPQSDVAHSTFAFASVGADGKFSLPNLNREPYVINVLSSGTGLYAKAMDMGGQNILFREVDLAQAGGAEIHVAMQPGAGQISGTVQDTSLSSSSAAKPKRAAVVLVPQMLSPDASNVTFSYTRGNSGFTFADLAPGNYWLFAVDFADPNIWQNPDFLQQMQSSGTPVAIPENGQVTVEVPRLSVEQVEAASQRVGLGS